MKGTSSKENILKKIRAALIQKTEQPFPQTDSTSSVYQSSGESLEILFAEEFTKVNGEFIFCEYEKEMVTNLEKLAEEKKWFNMYCWELPLQELFIKNDFRKCRIGKSIDKADAGITLCEALVARTGSIFLSSKQEAGRTLSVFPPVHIVVAYANQLVYDIKDGLHLLKEKYKDNYPSMVTLATGPSRTADIEKTLVLGAHGPKEVYVFFIDNIK